MLSSKSLLSGFVHLSERPNQKCSPAVKGAGTTTSVFGSRKLQFALVSSFEARKELAEAVTVGAAGGRGHGRFLQWTRTAKLDGSLTSVCGT